MSFKRSIKELLITLLKPHGYTVTRLDAIAAHAVPIAPPPPVVPVQPAPVEIVPVKAAEPSPPAPPPAPVIEPMESALADIQKRNHVFNTIIDIGASDGRWTAMALRHFPACLICWLKRSRFTSQHWKSFKPRTRTFNWL